MEGTIVFTISTLTIFFIEYNVMVSTVNVYGGNKCIHVFNVDEFFIHNGEYTHGGGVF